MQNEKLTTNKTHNQDIGNFGEQAATDYLIARGYNIVARNWRNRSGELDIIAVIGRTVVAVEVKTRSGTGFGSPLEAISFEKSQRLRRVFAAWLSQSKTSFDRVRIDAIGVLLENADTQRIVHVEAIA